MKKKEIVAIIAMVALLAIGFLTQWFDHPSITDNAQKSCWIAWGLLFAIPLSTVLERVAKGMARNEGKVIPFRDEEERDII